MRPYQVAVIGEEEGCHGQALKNAWLRVGITPVFLDAVSLRAQLGPAASVSCGPVRLNDMDLVMVRHVPGGSLEQVIYRMDALHQLENQGTRLVNRPGAIEKMVDKYYTLSLLQNANLRVPETVITENYEDAMSAYRDLGGDVIVKPLFGSRGAGMVRISSPEIASRTFRAMEMSGFVFYLQRFIPHENADMRVLVQNGTCLAAMRRISDQWKTNISQGAKPVRYAVEEDVRDASLAAAEAVGADYCGVDLMRSEDGSLFTIEVNSMPSWQGLQQVTDFDIAARLVDGFTGMMGWEY